MSSELQTTDALALPSDQGGRARLSSIGPNFRELVVAIRTGDDATVESAVVSLSQRSWGFGIGLALGFSTMVVQRWGLRWFGLSLGIVVGILMFTYVLVPFRLVGVKATHWRRDKLTAAAIGGAVGAAVCSPPYFLGRVAILMLGSRTLRVLAVFLLLVADVLQTGATSSVRAIKMSAKLAVNRAPAGDDPTAVSPSVPQNA